jgi:hypothetical protein
MVRLETLAQPDLLVLMAQMVTLVTPEQLDRKVD